MCAFKTVLLFATQNKFVGMQALQYYEPERLLDWRKKRGIPLSRL